MATIENGSTSVNAVKMYIYNDAVICGTLPAGVEEGLTWEDQLNGKYLLLSAAQIEFFLENPNLAASEIYNLTTDDEADYTFLREEYLKQNKEYYESLPHQTEFTVKYQYEDESTPDASWVFEYSYDDMEKIKSANIKHLYNKEGEKIEFTTEEMEFIQSSISSQRGRLLDTYKKIISEINKLQTKEDFKGYVISEKHAKNISVIVIEEIPT